MGAELKLSSESKEMIQSIADANDVNYGKLTFVLQAGKVIDAIIEKRIRL